MRRKEKEINRLEDMISIIEKAEICRLAMIDGDRPYMVPLNFGYRDNVLYFHSAGEGKKIEVLRKNPQVCFEIETGTAMIEAEAACDWSMQYKSIIGRGKAEFIDDPAEKAAAFDIIMHQYAPGRKYSYPPAMIGAVTLYKVAVEEISGKQSGYTKGSS